MIWRIRSRKVFSELRVRGTRVRNGPVRISHVAIDTPHPQLAFAIGRRFGNAVDRNRAQRRLRAAFADAWASAPGAPLGAYLVTADRSVLDAGFDRLVGSVRICLVQLGGRS